MKLLKHILKFDIIVLNLAVIVWGLLSVNSYRQFMIDNLTIPQSPIIINFIFNTILGCYLSSNSLMGFVYEFGKEDIHFIFHVINFLFMVTSFSFNFENFKSCNEDCKDIIGSNFYDFITYYEYLPVFQLLISIHYFCFFIYIVNTNRQAILVNEDYNDVFVQQPIEANVLRLDIDSNSDTSEGFEL